MADPSTIPGEDNVPMIQDSVFIESEFFLLVIFSVLLPSGIYGFLLLTKSISRWAVLSLAFILIVLSGIDVVLLQVLSEQAKISPSLVDNRIFSTELSITLYLLPAVFAGIGVNLISHVLIEHLRQAEFSFERQRERQRRHDPA